MEKKLVEGEDYYLDPLSGLLVFTEKYLRERGYCCSAGCRHCPWEGGWRRPADEA